VVVAQGDVLWADLPEPRGSEPGFVRPVVVIQGDSLNRSTVATVVCIPLTTNQRHAAARGNVLLPARSTGLPQDSVANVSLIFAADRTRLIERVGHLSEREIDLLFRGIDIVLGRE